jgi:anti-sigma regulatory factor (Ser/Thr protein kinase)
MLQDMDKVNLDTNQIVRIREKADIALARMQVRTFARNVGLDLFDQARISLATSTLAIILGMETQEEGEISIESIRDLGRVGVQVVCTKANASLQASAARVLDDAKQLVDGIEVEEMPSTGVRVILQKWPSRIDHRAPSKADPVSRRSEPDRPHPTSPDSATKEKPEAQAHTEQAPPQHAGPEIKIYTKFDIITARAAVRRFAASQGCDAMCQIAISLATWSLAHALEMGELYPGQIRADCLKNGQNSAVRVVCIRPLAAGHAFAEEVLDETKRLVDDLMVETLPSSEVRVTALKWIDRQNIP